MLDEQIHLYVGVIEGDDSQPLLACIGTLSVEEKRRAERFVFDRDRREFLMAHGLIRAALSRAMPTVDPSKWLINPDKDGRPYVAGPIGVGRLHFSLSHTKGCIACAVSPNEAVGIDVEECSPRDGLMEIAEKNFSADEIATLRALEPQEQSKRFFEYWTIKEAYIKARGKGLRIPLNSFSILGLTQKDIRIAFADEQNEDYSARWHFTQFVPSRRHQLAMADGSGTSGGIPVVLEPLPWV
jgi:4'-phosphopantetheinyl transferase